MEKSRLGILTLPGPAPVHPSRFSWGVRRIETEPRFRYVRTPGVHAPGNRASVSWDASGGMRVARFAMWWLEERVQFRPRKKGKTQMNRTSSLILHSALFVAAIATVPGTLLFGQRERTSGASPAKPSWYPPFPNGGFESALSGWNIDTCSSGFGDVTHSADAGVVGGDDGALYLDVFTRVDAIGAKFTGSGAQAQASVSRPFVVTDRYVEFDVGGGYGLCLRGQASGRMAGKVAVTDALGLRLEQSFVDVGPVRFSQTCPTGTCAAGIIAGSTVSLDLFSAGLQLGQLATIEVAVSATVVALETCETGDFGAGLVVDDFRLSGSASNSPRAATRVVRTPFESRSEWDALSWRALPAQDRASRIRSAMANQLAPQDSQAQLTGTVGRRR